MDERLSIAMVAAADEPGRLALARRCLHDERATLTEAPGGFVPEGEAAALLFSDRRDVKSPAMTDDDRNRHDFKNQLAVIRGFAEVLLAEAAEADPRRRDLEEIHNAAVTALDLLERMYPGPVDASQ